jgi:hypothetical protein
MVRKQIVYHAQKIGIWSLLISIQFKIDQIIYDRPNIAVTYLIIIFVNQIIVFLNVTKNYSVIN